MVEFNSNQEKFEVHFISHQKSGAYIDYLIKINAPGGYTF